MEIEFKIRGEFIDLLQLLKATGIAESGAHAQALVMDGLVKLNDVTETRKRAKIFPGNKVEVLGNTILLE